MLKATMDRRYASIENGEVKCPFGTGLNLSAEVFLSSSLPLRRVEAYQFCRKYPAMLSSLDC